MRPLIPIILFALATSAWAGELSTGMAEPGDFVVLDEAGKIQLVGHLDLDFTALFRTYAEGRRERRRAPFAIGLYRDGKIMDVSRGQLEYLIADDRLVFSFRPGVPDAGLNFVIHFDPSQEISIGEASEGNIAGPKPVGTARVRFRKASARRPQ